MEIIAKNKYVKSSDQKLRLLVRSINYKNNSLINVLNCLNFSNKKTAFIIRKTLNSAINNAKNNFNLNINNIKIKNIFINKGKHFKRIFPRAKGKTDYITKKTSHVTIVLTNIK